MEKIYRANHVAAYCIYELKDQSFFINSKQLQHLLRVVDLTWKKIFGHGAFREETHPHADYYVHEVYMDYKENEYQVITEPAREWYLPYGKFQLCYRPYGVPPYSPFESVVMKKILKEYIRKNIAQAS